ncbi:Do family serine endopeptidase [Roseospirillum parvum]|nr:Do family serine endopeptidase [Roseospirillum parvum]
MRWLGAILAILLVLGLPAGVGARVPDSAAEISLTFAPVVEAAAPAVVNVYSRKVIENADQMQGVFRDPFFRRFFGDHFGLGLPRRQRIENALGSGVLIREDGIVVTNHHVIEGSDEITVVLSDRREFEAEIVGADERTDIAVLRLIDPPPGLPHLIPRRSDDLKVGDLVVAVGNPFGVGQTVTMGIVSALARTTVGVTDFRSFIQTDAAINPGNSGGALVDTQGRLVGINTAIYSRSGGSNGIGFAIPAELVSATVAGILEYGRPVRPWLGAEGQAVEADMAEALGLEVPRGVLINQVTANGPAARAGLAVGDVVVAVDGRPVSDEQALRFRVATLSVGGQAALRVLRNGQPRDLTIELVAPPEQPPSNINRIDGRSPFAGTTVANLNPALIEELGLGPGEGVVILDVARGTPARRVGLRPGDRVAEVNGSEITRVVDLIGELRRHRGPAWRAVILRGERRLVLSLGG